MKLKILSYNIHKGFALDNRKFILEGIRAALRELNPDILFLQEVLGDHKNNKIHIPDWTTQFEYLADTHWPHHSYGKNAVYDEGHHGNAILSKFPIQEWSNHTVSRDRPEPRGLLKARIHIEEWGEDLILANTHLDLTQGGRNEQTKNIIANMSEEKTPWIMVGDFNDWNKKISPRIEEKLDAREAFKALKGSYPKTFPSFYPFLSLDRVFLHRLKPTHTHALLGSPWKNLSDHLPLYVELERDR